MDILKDFISSFIALSLRYLLAGFMGGLGWILISYLCGRLF